MATYSITNAAELQAMNDDLAGDYILENDIDLTGVVWTPVGNYPAFTGTFDGQGFIISNLSMTLADDTESGLFGIIQGATVQNLKLYNFSFVLHNDDLGVSIENIGTLAGNALLNSTTGCIIKNCSSLNINISSTNQIEMVGGLVGFSEYTEFDTCITSGDIIVTVTDDASFYVAKYVGGLVGWSMPSSFNDCSSEVNLDISGSDEIQDMTCGVLVGYIVDEETEYNSITNCHATGTITADKVNCSGVGGLIGELDTDKVVTVSGCYYEGEMTFTNSFGYDVAGLIGYNEATSIDNCYVKADISISNSTVDRILGVAGLIGEMYSLGTINKCYFSGNIEVINSNESDGGVSCVAGIIGQADVSNPDLITFSNCYAWGNINVRGMTYCDAGGFVGEVYDAVQFQNCYADVDVTVDGSGDWVMVGGFADEYGCDKATPIENCYSVGTVTNNGTFVEADVGGFIGYSDDYDTYVLIQNCAWRTGSTDNSIGGADSENGSPIPLLATNGYGTDEPDNTKFYSKTHQVYAQV